MSEQYTPEDFVTPTPGLLHVYDPQNRLIAFETGKLESPNSVVFIGGLGDGINPVPYLSPLANSLETIGWSLFQILLTSSYSGFGFSSIENDAMEIQRFLKYLEEIGRAQFVLLGHSTGCQDIVKYLNLPQACCTDRCLGILGVILQAPVSDREYMVETLGENAYRASLKAAKQLVKHGEGSTPIPSEFSDMFCGGRGAISASRWLSLASPLQDFPTGEDFFSSDLPDDLLAKNLSAVGRMKLPSMVILGGRDETMSSSVDKVSFLKRLVKAMSSPSSEGVCSSDEICQEWSAILEGAGHQVEEAKEELCERIISFIRVISMMA